MSNEEFDQIMASIFRDLRIIKWLLAGQIALLLLTLVMLP